MKNTYYLIIWQTVAIVNQLVTSDLLSDNVTYFLTKVHSLISDFMKLSCAWILTLRQSSHRGLTRVYYSDAKVIIQFCEYLRWIKEISVPDKHASDVYRESSL